VGVEAEREKQKGCQRERETVEAVAQQERREHFQAQFDLEKAEQ
jgi:hypothetical protein